jgi:tetratricopeptide (TPR) repeat protein
MMAGTSQRYAPAGWAEEILDAAVAADLPQLPRLYAAAAYCSPTGRAEVSVDYARAAVALEGDPRYDPFEPGWARLMEAHGLRFAGRVDRQLEIYAALAAEHGLARVLGLCGMLYALPIVGRTKEALAIAEEAVAAARAHGNPCWIAWTFNGCARASAEIDPRAALTALRNGLVYTREHRLPYWESILARDAARLEAVHGELEQALELFDNTIDSFHRAGNTASVAATLADLAVLFNRLERPDTAATIYGTSTHHDSAKRTDNLRDVLEHLRASLGPTRFNECVAAGAAMDPADAVQYARRQIQCAASRVADATVKPT